MRHYPILFSTPMVQAILERRKIQTRRVVKQSSGWDNVWKVSHEGNGSYCMRTGTQYSIPFFKCPYGQPGDVLWVRETWCYIGDTASADNDKNRFHYLASKGKNNFTWKPSIHMPKEACRLFLRVKSVRVERLQDISEQDAISEGIQQSTIGFKNYDKNYPVAEFIGGGTSATRSFKSLWQSINGAESWDANPWVWVVEFERITKEEAGI